MSQLYFYVLDSETTGLSASESEVIEVSIVRCSDRVQLTEFIKPDYPERASYDCLRIQNKTLQDLEKGNTREYAVERINKFLNEDGVTPAHRCFICHNAPFDKKFIHALYDKVGQKCPADLWVCTMSLTREYAKKQGIVKPKVNLHAACDLLQIKKLSAAHASKVDSRNTYLLWKELIENRKVDYLPFIKTAIHQPTSNDDEYLDILLLDEDS